MSQSFIYAFTITLRPKLYIHEPEEQYDLVCEYLVRKLEGLCKSVTLVAEVTQNFNIHLHGICDFIILPKMVCEKEFKKCFRNDTKIGFVNIKEMTDAIGWSRYMKKDLVKTMNALNRRPVLLDDFDIFNMEERAVFGVTW